MIGHSLDARLAESYFRYVNDLATVLDPMGGVAEVMCPGWLTDISERLDLSAVVGKCTAADRRSGPSAPAAERRRAALTWTYRLTGQLNSLDASTRLSLRMNRDYRWFREIVRLTTRIDDLHRRTGMFIRSLAEAGQRAEHPVRVLDRARLDAALLEGSFDLGVGAATVRALARAPARPRVLAEDLDVALTAARDLAQDLIRPGGDPRAGSTTLALVQARARARDLARLLARARDLARALVHELIQDLVRGKPFLHRTPRTSWLVGPTEVRSADSASVSGLWACLERVTYDFVGADLRDASLDRVPLVGILWSDETRWPREWEDRIRRRSVEAEPGTLKVDKEERDGRRLADQCL